MRYMSVTMMAMARARYDDDDTSRYDTRRYAKSDEDDTRYERERRRKMKMLGEASGEMRRRAPKVLYDSDVERYDGVVTRSERCAMSYERIYADVTPRAASERAGDDERKERRRYLFTICR